MTLLKLQKNHQNKNPKTQKSKKKVCNLCLKFFLKSNQSLINLLSLIKSKNFSKWLIKGKKLIWPKLKREKVQTINHLHKKLSRKCRIITTTKTIANSVIESLKSSMLKLINTWPFKHFSKSSDNTSQNLPKNQLLLTNSITQMKKSLS